jgi:crotonobetainyl-CoA:carnitine CoA-transferase CaiB-like acyl-CoA transferase
MGRPDLATDPRYAMELARDENKADCIAEFDAIFASRPLAEWREILAKQEGQWDIVQHVGEMQHDPQVLANGYLQPVTYGDGRVLKMVSSPMQFDGEPFPSGPAPEIGAHSDEVLAELGYDEEAITALKVANVVF